MRDIQIRASSPSCRYTDGKALVSGKLLKNNFAGPKLEGGVPQAWWEVALLPGHRLTCNYYYLRHDGSPDFPRHWVLQVGASRMVPISSICT